MTMLTVPALPPRLAQRYQVGPVLGRGVGSTVFRAHDTLLRRDAAVKTFPVAPESCASSAWCLLAPADHPGLVPVYDVEHRDGRAFVVMALLEGGSLATRLEACRESAGGERAGGLALGESLRTAATVAGALDHLHHVGEAHRAVTPSNVVYDTEDRVLLGDVGVAQLAITPRLGESGLPVSTAAYVAPEQLRGAAPGPQADVYALGLVLIEALTGRRAFPGDPESAARARLERPPTVPGGLPAPVAELVSAMTADDPAQRPAAADTATALRRALLEAAPTLTLITGLGQPPGGGAVTGCGSRAGWAAARPRRAPTDHPRPGITAGPVTARGRGWRVLAGVAASAVLAAVVALAASGALAGWFADLGASPAAVASGGAALGVPDPPANPLAAPAAPRTPDPNTPGSVIPLSGAPGSASAAEESYAPRTSRARPAQPAHPVLVPAARTSSREPARTLARAPHDSTAPDGSAPSHSTAAGSTFGEPSSTTPTPRTSTGPPTSPARPSDRKGSRPRASTQDNRDQASNGHGGTGPLKGRSPESKDITRSGDGGDPGRPAQHRAPESGPLPPVDGLVTRGPTMHAAHPPAAHLRVSSVGSADPLLVAARGPAGNPPP